MADYPQASNGQARHARSAGAREPARSQTSRPFTLYLYSAKTPKRAYTTSLAPTAIRRDKNVDFNMRLTLPVNTKLTSQFWPRV